MGVEVGRRIDLLWCLFWVGVVNSSVMRQITDSVLRCTVASCLQMSSLF
jgi:hypothetical protein